MSAMTLDLYLCCLPLLRHQADFEGFSSDCGSLAASFEANRLVEVRSLTLDLHVAIVHELRSQYVWLHRHYRRSQQWLHWPGRDGNAFERRYDLCNEKSPGAASGYTIRSTRKCTLVSSHKSGEVMLNDSIRGGGKLRPRLSPFS